jgi:hypothetical protein
VSDRELLELAAKAAGILPLPDGKELDAAPDGGLMICGGGEVKYWNPLTDDGDALRLTVTLRINIEHAETLGRESHGVNCWPVGQGHCAWMENDLTDYNAATRRAIVRAAAEVGRNMP